MDRGLTQLHRLDGSHKLKEVENFCVLYKARVRPNGHLQYFNFKLAKEIGLIEENLPELITEDFECEVVQDLGIVIINEYDIENNRKFKKETIKSGEYMATRYLQMQHEDETGKTSGDGRSIWYGEFKSKNGAHWDIVGRGTGGTKLSVGYNLHKKAVRTGDGNSYYASGIALDKESVHTVFSSEVLHQLGFDTERTLAMIKFPKGQSIIVKAHQNMIRPAHILAPYFQKNISTSKEIFEHYINREFEHGKFEIKSDKYLDWILSWTKELSRNLALYEMNNMFVWFDWDGDNILISGGMLDLSTTMRMGAFYKSYRIDDIVRWSTGLSEQFENCFKTYKQLLDIIDTCFELNIDKEIYYKLFVKNFERERSACLLSKLGFKKTNLPLILDLFSKEVEEIVKSFIFVRDFEIEENYYECLKGVSRQALYSFEPFFRNVHLGSSANDLLNQMKVIVDYKYDEDVFALEHIKKILENIKFITKSIEYNPEESLAEARINTPLYKSTGTSDRKIQLLLSKKTKKNERLEFNELVNFFVKTQNNNFEFDLPSLNLKKEQRKILGHILDNRLNI